MDSEHPENFICPITLDLMLEPVKASDGYTYDKTAIIDWYKKSAISPFTREDLSPEFISLNELKEEIKDYISKNNLNIPKYCPINSVEEKNNDVSDTMDNDIIQLNCHTCQEYLLFSKLEGRTICSNCRSIYTMKRCINCRAENIVNNSQSFICSTCNFLNRLTTRFRRNNSECVIC